MSKEENSKEWFTPEEHLPESNQIVVAYVTTKHCKDDHKWLTLLRYVSDFSITKKEAPLTDSAKLSNEYFVKKDNQEWLLGGFWEMASCKNEFMKPFTGQIIRWMLIKNS